MRFVFFFLNYSSGGNYSQYSTNAKPFKRCHFLSLNAASKAYHIKVYNITTKSYRGEYKGRIIKHREQSSKKRKQRGKQKDKKGNKQQGTLSVGYQCQVLILAHSKVVPNQRYEVQKSGQKIKVHTFIQFFRFHPLSLKI